MNTLVYKLFNNGVFLLFHNAGCNKENPKLIMESVMAQRKSIKFSGKY